MRPQAIVFFPHNPVPPRSGAHRRCLAVLAALVRIGLDVILTSSTYTSETTWDSQAVEELRELGIGKTIVYPASASDRAISRMLSRYYRTLPGDVPLGSPLYSPPSVRRAVRQLVNELSPDVFLMNYAYFDPLVDHKALAASVTIIDTHDLATLNSRMQSALRRYLTPFPVNPDRLPIEVLAESFFTNLGLCADPKEYRVYDRYNHTLAVSPGEAELIRSHAARTVVQYAPITHDPVYIANSYDGVPIFASGPNLFNLQGYAYLAKRVLPAVLASIPDFELAASGPLSHQAAFVPGIRLVGYVPDLASLYERARFSTCPLLGGTGQKVKIVESMAHGVPVIATTAGAEGSPIRHELNGIIASDPESFGEWMVRLWHDRRLCRRLGEYARETVQKEHSSLELQRVLQRALAARSIAQ